MPTSLSNVVSIIFSISDITLLQNILTIYKQFMLLNSYNTFIIRDHIIQIKDQNTYSFRHQIQHYTKLNNKLPVSVDSLIFQMAILLTILWFNSRTEIQSFIFSFISVSFIRSCWLPQGLRP